MKVPEAIIDAIIAAAFVVMGVLMMAADSLLTNSGFESHMSGISMGMGIGWIVKSYMVRARQRQQSPQTELPELE